jgi:tRNA splicing endonuclease
MALRKASLVVYSSILMQIWQRLRGLKISCDFAVYENVIRKNRRFLVLVLSEDDRREVVIYLRLTTPIP